jgi:hypothetical protein
MGDDYSNCEICDQIHYDQGDRCSDCGSELCPDCHAKMINKYGKEKKEINQINVLIV